jgi:hypothetical protein
MDEMLPEGETAFIAIAGSPEPMPYLDRPSPRCPEARRALALAILGVLFLGLVFGPLALALGHRATLAIADEPRLGDARVARAAIALGKVGLAVHLTIAVTIVPWVLFVLPLVAGG